MPNTIKMDNQEVSKDDFKFFVEKGDPNFNPKHNQQVIDGTIKKYELKRKRQMADWTDKLRERTDVVATYFKSRAAESNKPIDKYLSKKYLSYLQGKRIMEVIRNGQSMLVEVSRNDGA